MPSNGRRPFAVLVLHRFPKLITPYLCTTKSIPPLPYLFDVTLQRFLCTVLKYRTFYLLLLFLLPYYTFLVC